MLHVVVASAVALLWSSSAFAQAGGLTLPEQGGPISGTSQAGQAAIARDASTAWLNPAGLTRLDESQFLVGTQILDLTSEFDPDPQTTTTGSDGGNGGDTHLAGSLYLAMPINERLTFGASITSPYGLPLDYGSDWVGRSFVTELDLLTINIDTSLGIAVNDWLSVGIGLDIQYADLEQDLIVPVGSLEVGASIDGDNWEVGATLGLLAELSESTRFGLRYRTEMDHDLGGDLQTIANLKTTINLTLPQSLMFSAYHELNEQWALMADLGWTDWSAFDRTVINIKTSIPIEEIDIPRNWDDTWNLGFGAHYRFAEQWLFMTGVSYVSSAVDDEDRTPDIPTDEQWRLSVGIENDVSESFHWGATYTYAYLGDNKLDATNFTGRVVGDYNSPMHVLGGYAMWTF